MEVISRRSGKKKKRGTAHELWVPVLFCFWKKPWTKGARERALHPLRQGEALLLCWAVWIFIEHYWTHSQNHLFCGASHGIWLSPVKLNLVTKDKAAVPFGVCQTSPPEVKVSKSHLTLQFGMAEFAEITLQIDPGWSNSSWATQRLIQVLPAQPGLLLSGT